MRALVLCLAALCFVGTGCTLLVNPNQYVGNGRDAGLGGDGAPSDAQRDGSQDGSHANTPPILEGVGLDEYDPSVGDTMHAVPGPVFDAEGDHTTLHYQWYLNGTAASGATTSAFDTTAHAAGDHVRVEAWANDGMVDGPHVSAGDVTLAPNVTRWRQRLPNNADEKVPRIFWDEANHRAIRLIEGDLWEYAITPNGMRILRLPASGPAPADDQFQITALDPPHHRLIVYTSSDLTHIYSLDLSHRGAEVWTRTAASGNAPMIAPLSQVFFDPGTQRIWVIGGFQDSMGAIGGVNSLDVSMPGAETWSSHTTTGAALPPMFAAAAVSDATTPNRVYLFGGVTTPVSHSTFVMRDHVLQLDLTATAVTVTESPVMLASPSWGSVAAYDAMSHQYLVYGGFNVFGSAATPLGLALYDLAAGSSTTMAPAANHVVGIGSLTPDSHQPGHFVAVTEGGDLLSDSGDSYPTIEDVTATAAPTLLGVDQRPNALYGASGRLSSGVINVIDGYERHGVSMSQWTIDLSTFLWTPYTTMPDTVLGGMPPVRFGVVGETGTGNTFNPPSIFEIGGLRDTGVLADMEAWELVSDGHWVDHHLATGQTPPAARVGAVIWHDQCGGSTVSYFGGEDATGSTFFGDVGDMHCTGTRSCMWSTTAVDPGRSYAALAYGRQHAFVFGGHNMQGSGAMNDLLAINICSNPPSLDTVTVTGAPPSPRYGHSSTAVYDAMTNLASFLVFGGENGNTNFDTYRFTFSSDLSGSWSPITLADGVHPAARSRHLAFWDDVQHRLIVVGGALQSQGGTPAGDLWELLIRP
jgi:hypothetical protein